MPEFRFTLDPAGTPVVIENPIGWNEAKIRIIRDKELRGMFLGQPAVAQLLGQT